MPKRIPLVRGEGRGLEEARGGLEEVTRRSRGGHEEVTRRSRGGHEEVTRRATSFAAGSVTSAAGVALSHASGATYSPSQAQRCLPQARRRGAALRPAALMLPSPLAPSARLRRRAPPAAEARPV
eukprot:CAMPEP_0181249312 /NCGR_PEP_ID=MMETSP1096-20121128/45680_1 /TAXON_ID=156174 ORGANISM="Chrysochromulina ericina, Strain CCMP281" /NCGR_SAMPLE_ID=MMETSP1096 /ASSEMBLY_ACC=CAM_ASM_000453 /LENGTH=124 /DNA_ID=CAMNT_0023346627 /DNA_START=395 /DNA_END=766 /DNA_ORIENTATION=+